MVLSIAKVSNASQGISVGAYRTVAEWTEGNARFERWKKIRPVKGTGSGVTWQCALDSDIANATEDCENPWFGGLAEGAVPTDITLHTKGMTHAVWDVTVDVKAALTSGLHDVSWIIDKTSTRHGGALYFSREGAALLYAPQLAPTLILE